MYAKVGNPFYSVRFSLIFLAAASPTTAAISSLNGEAVSLAWTDDSIPGVPAQSYYAVKTYEDGDKVNITAAAEGMKDIPG